MLFRTPQVGSQEQEVIDRIGETQEKIRWAVHEPRVWTGLLRRSLFAKAIQGSNSIEGYNMTLDDAIAVAEGEAPVDADEPTRQALEGYRRAMTYVLRLANDRYFSYTSETVRSLHFMMMDQFLDKEPGTYRSGVIFVRESGSGDIVYEGPEAERVPGLVQELMDQLNESNDMPVMVRAAMAHLNLVLIHPFKDGNGRMARCLQTMVLAREGILVPEFCSIEEYLGRNTQAYYKVLADVGGGYWQPENDARGWVRFCLTAHYRQTKTVQRRWTEAERLWGLLLQLVQSRGLPERYMFALFDASMGYRVRRATYQPVAEVSDKVATKDLGAIVDAGLLTPIGERRGRYYVAASALDSIRNKAFGARLPIEDPFEVQPASDRG
ncbi:MAG: Fic family protein [Actinomycetota bacterium]